MKLSLMRKMLLASGALGAAGLAAGAAAQQPDGGTLAPVVVTANKLEGGALAGGASAVATAARLESAHVARTDELDKVFPELGVMPRSTRVYSLFSMRGVPSIDFYNPAVTVYVDGVPQDLAYFTQPLAGIEQVELLKGPQGTLYGRSAQGGVINIVTAKPGNKPLARLNVDGNRLMRRADVQLGGALLPNTLYGDITAYADERPGQLRMANGRDKLGGGKESMGRARLRWTPADSGLDAMLTVSRDSYHAHDEYFQAFPLRDRKAIAGTPFDLTDPDIRRTVNQAALALDYYFDEWKLTSSTSYQDRKFERVLSTGNADPESQKSYYQELRLATIGSGQRAVDGVFGLYYEKQDFERRRGVAVPNVPSFLFPGPSLGESSNKSMALFGEAVWHINPALDLSAGLRYSVDKARIDFRRSGAAALVFAGDKRFTHVSPKLALGYRLAPEWRAYALFSEGYKAGGFNRVAENQGGSLPYEDETLRNFELGIKGDLLNRRLQLDGAVFHSSTRDLQAQVQSSLFQMLSNVGDARARGVELNAAFAATPDLTLRAGAAWTHSTIRNFHAPAGNVDLNGKRVPYVAPLSVRASGEWRFRPFQDGSLLRWNVSAQVSGDQWFDAANTLRQPGYAQFDTALSWDIDKRYSLTAYVDNLGDKVVPTYAFAFGPLGNFAQYSRGRMAGLRLKVQL
ncbi:TonB-dependent receptor [Massilia sp. NR 4-1]|uniref:TonB-dependent receptor n=1 Tax=Massilia sp. NR 4-1 TaxID=1678028 RepID=UPI00067D80E8|nr:TonB-dependent receptor [Massilia sp. NR 4-1]AKU20508.1 ligand-gated channel [Massilia sp. NR 4-1]